MTFRKKRSTVLDEVIESGNNGFHDPGSSVADRKSSSDRENSDVLFEPQYEILNFIPTSPLDTSGYLGSSNDEDDCSSSSKVIRKKSKKRSKSKKKHKSRDREKTKYELTPAEEDHGDDDVDDDDADDTCSSSSHFDRHGTISVNPTCSYVTVGSKTSCKRLRLVYGDVTTTISYLSNDTP